MKAGWEVKPLGEVCGKITDGSHNPPKGVELSDFLMLSSKNVWDDRIIFDKPRFLSEQHFWDENKRTDVTAGDVLLTIVGTIGRCAVVSESDRKFTLQRSVAVLKPLADHIDSRFLMYALQSMLERLVDGSQGAAQKGIYLKALRVLPIPIPPLEEQKRIVAVLDAAFEGLTRAKENAEANLQNARELFEAGRSSIFEAQLKNSPLVQLGKICSRVSVGHVGETTKHYVEEGGVPFLRSQNVRPTGIELDGAKRITHDFHMSLKKSQLIGGELLFVRVGANRGQCCYVPEGLGELNCANVVFGRPKTGNVNYLAHYCQSRVGQENLLGMTTGSAQGVINTRSVATLPIPMPEESIQFETSKNLDRLQSSSMATEDQYGTKLTDIADLRQSLLQKAFAGELT